MVREELEQLEKVAKIYESGFENDDMQGEEGADKTDVGTDKVSEHAIGVYLHENVLDEEQLDAWNFTIHGINGHVSWA